MDALSVAVLPAVIAGVCAVVGSAIGSSDLPTGWVRKTVAMVDLYERLPHGSVPMAFETLAREMLRREIYARVYAGLGYRVEDDVPVPRDDIWPRVKDAAVQCSVALAASLIDSGVPSTVRGWAVTLGGLAFGYLVVVCVQRMLSVWPPSPWNPVYRSAMRERERRRKSRDELKELFEKYDSWLVSDYSRNGARKAERDE